MSKITNVLPFDCDTGEPLFWVPWSQDNDAAIVRRSGRFAQYEFGNNRRYELRPFENVELSLHYVGYNEGTMPLSLRYADESGIVYNVTFDTIDKLLKSGNDVSSISGTFTALRRGYNYSIAPDSIISS